MDMVVVVAALLLSTAPLSVLWGPPWGRGLVGLYFLSWGAAMGPWTSWSLLSVWGATMGTWTGWSLLCVWGATKGPWTGWYGEHGVVHRWLSVYLLFKGSLLSGRAGSVCS